MTVRAWLLSVIAHAALLGGAFYWYTGANIPKDANLELTAPLGDVFVKEEPAESNPALAMPLPPSDSAPESPPSSSGNFPGDVKEPPAQPSFAASSGEAGTPDGEASPVGKIQPAYPEISRRLGIPVGSIGPSRARCLARARRLWEERGLPD